MFSIISNTKGDTILQYKENICQLIYSNTWNHINYFNFQIFQRTKLGCIHNCFHMSPWKNLMK